jgi:hypothetical protein
MGKRLIVISIISCFLLLPGFLNTINDGQALDSFQIDDDKRMHEFLNSYINDEWNKTFGGTGVDSAFHVEETSDGGYILVGGTGSYAEYGYEDIWLIKTDHKGNILWEKFFGGEDLDQGLCVRETLDSGFIIVGITYSFSSRVPHDENIILIKTDKNGNEVWTKIIDNTAGDESGMSVRQTDDNGYIIVGDTNANGASFNVYLIKTDEYGDELWNKTFDGGGFDGGDDVSQTDDGGYIIVGVTSKMGGGLWLIKTDDIGNLLWDKVLGKGSDWGHCIQVTRDGCYIISGYTSHYGMGSQDVWLVKTDNNGYELWNHTFGGGGFDWANHVSETSDGGYILVGGTGSFSRNGGNDLWLIKTDMNGNKLWGRILGGSDFENGHCVQETSDGGYIIVGWTESFGSGKRDCWLVKVTPDNGPPCKPVITGPSNGKVYRSYEYTVRSIDPEDDDIYYLILWDDSISGWMGPYESGENVTFSHSWPSEGMYSIQVKAIDIHGWDSLLSDPLPVIIPKNNNNLFDLLGPKVFHNHPWLFPFMHLFSMT